MAGSIVEACAPGAEGFALCVTSAFGAQGGGERCHLSLWREKRKKDRASKSLRSERSFHKHSPPTMPVTNTNGSFDNAEGVKIFTQVRASALASTDREVPGVGTESTGVRKRTTFC